MIVEKKLREQQNYGHIKPIWVKIKFLNYNSSSFYAPVIRDQNFVYF